MYNLPSLLLIGVIIMTISGACTTDKQPTHHMETTTNLNDTSLKGATIMNKMTFKEHVDMYWKFFFEKGEKIPREPLPQRQPDLTKLFQDGHNGVKSVWLGHSTLLISIDGYTILTDPIFQRKVSPIGPTRFHPELPLSIDDLDAVDVVIISHDHYDHLNKYSVQQLRDKAGVFIVPTGVGTRLVKWGIPTEKIVELNWWDEYRPTGELKIVATPAQHFSGRGLFDRNKTLWASWVIKTHEHRVFFSGDSGYFSGFKTIGDMFGPFDVTFLECGAYNPRWSNVHMFPEQTVLAFNDLGGKILQPIHMATFNLSLHSWYDPMERLISKAWHQGARVSTPIIGEVVNYEKQVAANLWWVPAMERSKQQTDQHQLAAQGNL